MPEPLKALFVEDNPNDLELLVRELEHSGYDLSYKRVETEEDLKSALENENWDIVFSDYVLPRFSGISAYNEFEKHSLDIPFILVSGTIGEQQAVKAMKAGVHDFISKDNLSRLAAAVRRELKETNNRKSNEALKQSMMRAQRLEAVGVLSGGIAHDFNNLLTIIMGNCGIAARKLSEDNPAHVYFERISRVSERAAKLTSQLLAFGRKQILKLERQDLNGIVRELQQIIDSLITEDVQLSLDLQELPAWVNVDSAQMEQIIVNLTINARDAMPEGGKITIQTSEVLIDPDDAELTAAVEPGEYIQLKIADTGTGIASENLEHVFEPFFSTKEVGKGTGLGLSVVYGIVSQSKGTLTIDTELGKGTAINIYLPKADSDQGFAAKAFDTESRGTDQPMLQNASILIVEDEDEVRILLKEILETSSYKVTISDSAKSALEAIDNGLRPDLVVTDVIMPGMKGVELIEELEKKLASFKYLYITGYSNEAIAKYNLLSPNVPLLQKPFSSQDFLTKLEELLTSSTE